MRAEKIEIHILFATSEEMKSLADKMENEIKEKGTFSEEIYLNESLTLKVQAGSEGDKKTRAAKDGNILTLTTNPWELNRVSELIESRLDESDIGDNLTITEYVGNNIVVRIVAEQE